MMMETKSFAVKLLKNIGAAVAFVLLFAFIANLVLGVATRHNREISVPDFTNLSFSEARKLASDAGVKVTISDSIYMRRARRGAVISQNPAVGAKVKNGRTIALTVNSMTPKKVKMPGLVGCSMRQAKAELSSKGLVLGRLVYVSDIATNNVLRQVYRGLDIAAGEDIASGSTINLYVGLNSSDANAYVPNVVGMKYLQAVDAIHDNSLNVGKLTFDSSVSTYADSLNAVVCSQRPSAIGLPMVMGGEISLSLSIDESKIGH